MALSARKKNNIRIQENEKTLELKRQKFEKEQDRNSLVKKTIDNFNFTDHLSSLKLPAILKQYIQNSPESYTNKKKSSNHQTVMFDLYHYIFYKYKYPTFLKKYFYISSSRRSYHDNPDFSKLTKTHHNFGEFSSNAPNVNKGSFYAYASAPSNKYTWKFFASEESALIKEVNAKMMEDYEIFFSWEVYLAILISSGASLKKTFFKNILSKKEIDKFLTCQNDEFSMSEALIYSIAYANSNILSSSVKLAKTKIKDMDNFLYSRFWREFIIFTAKDPDTKGLTVENLDDLIDYIQYIYSLDPDFTFYGKKLTIKQLLIRTHSWHRELSRKGYLSNQSWKGADIPDLSDYIKHATLDLDEAWTLTQIKTGKELFLEGRHMRHCVNSYLNRCISGHCSIWSLKCNDVRVLTVEVVERGSKHKIAQIRGKLNRLATQREKNIIATLIKNQNFLPYI